MQEPVVVQDILCGGCDKIWTVDNEGDVVGKFSHLLAEQCAVDDKTGEELIIYPGEMSGSKHIKWYCSCGEPLIDVKRAHGSATITVIKKS